MLKQKVAINKAIFLGLVLGAAVFVTFFSKRSDNNEKGICKMNKTLQCLEARTYSERIETLIEKMTVAEKIGQLRCVCGMVMTDKDVRMQVIKDVRSGRTGNISYITEFEDRLMLQKEAVENSRLGIPLLIGRDVLNGYKTTFPVAIAQAATWDMEAIEASERVAAAETTADGYFWTFTPMVDVSRDPRWGRNVEGSGEDAYLASQVAAARVRGFQGDDLSDPETMLACMKHFVGYGDVQAGREYHAVDMSQRKLYEYHLPAFKAAVDAGVRTVMPAFNEIAGTPATANKALLKDLLRDQWGFDGAIVSDFEAVLGLTYHGTVADDADAAAQAFNAGVEIEMTSNLYGEHMEELIASGRVKIEDIDNAVKNILKIKEELGLFDDPYRYLNHDRRQAMLDREIDKSLAYRLASESLVLLQNNDDVLPLSSGKKIAVIGPLANAKRDYLSWGMIEGKWEDMESLKEGVERMNIPGKTLYAKGCEVNDDDRSGFDKAVKIAKQCDVVIMMLGESWEMCGEACSRSKLGFPGVQGDLLRAVSETGTPVVIVIMGGRPLALEEESKLAQAIVEAWYAGHGGPEAIVDTLFGKFNPQGKLPMTFPRNVGQIPIHYDTKPGCRPQSNYEDKDFRWCSRYTDVSNSPLYPFGHGLSYTTYQYSDLTLSSETMLPGNTIQLKFKLSNTGNYDGTEVVQLYIRDRVASVTRPVKQLKGFKRIELKAGETKEVSFTIDEEMLSFYRKDMTWGTEPGEFEIFVGGSSDADKMVKLVLI